MELLDALRLQWEWGADEALLSTPQDRRHAPPLVPPPTIIKPATPSQRRLASPVLAGPEDAARLAATCTSLDQLKDAMQNFEGCALKHTASQLVFADGAENARLVIVGEAPGGEEDSIGKPFVGPAGLLLDKMLGSIGLDRTTVRIINTVPWRPPGNRAPTETEIALCLPFLHRHIALIEPLGIMALGAVASKALLGSAAQPGIRRLRGQWHQASINGLPTPLPCLPSYHPAYLLRMPMAKKEAWEDMLNLYAWLKGQEATVKKS